MSDLISFSSSRSLSTLSLFIIIVPTGTTLFPPPTYNNPFKATPYYADIITMKLILFFPNRKNFGDQEVSGEELHEILREIDTNMNGQVELDEYLQVRILINTTFSINIFHPFWLKISFESYSFLHLNHPTLAPS